MHFLYTIVCLCILVFNSYNVQVHALLNITEEALITSRRFLKEIEGSLFITNEDELYNKLNIINKIAYDFEKKYDYEIQSSKYSKYDIWYHSKKQVKKINAPLSFINIISKFMILKEKIVESQWVINKHSDILYNGTISKRPKEIFDKEFPEFAKNKYNLIIKEKNKGFIFNYESRYMQDVFNELYQLFFYTDKQSHLSIFEFLKNTTKYISGTDAEPAFTRTTPQLTLFYTIRDLIVGEAFFCVRHQYFVALVKVFSEASAFLKNEDRRALDLMQRNWGELDALNAMKMYEEKFEVRSTEVLNKVKPALFTLSRHFSEPIRKGSSYEHAVLEVFAKYIINEVDLNADGTCKRTCSDYNEVERVFGCFDGGICSVHRKCKGKLWDCENIVEPSYICASGDNNEEKRYTFIKVYRPLQDDSFCPTELIKAESWRRGFYKCSYCQCKCEETETYSNRYFSLRPVTSDTYDNYVVVGIRFQVFDHVLHLQVLQAKLLPNGQLGSETDRVAFPRTFNVTDYDVVKGKDFQAVTGDARTVCFDQLQTPNDHLLTGARLKFQDGYFKLEIHMTQFDYTSGMLFPEKSFWYSKDTNLNERPKINLDEFLDEPNNSIKTEGCVQFTTNRGKYKDEQSTVPYIRTYTLYTDRTAPLSGVGMILRKEVHDVFIDFQLVNQDVAVYMK